MRGTAEHIISLPDGVTAALRRRAGELGVPLTAVFLAAHVKVLALLSGDPLVRSGIMPPGRDGTLSLELTVHPGTWHELVLAVQQAGLTALPTYAPSGSTPDVVFDASGREPDLPAEDSVLRISAEGQDGRYVLRLRYRTDALDADCAARIGGYHLTALEQIAFAVDTPHDQSTLLSPEELHFQLHKLAGPDRALPDSRFHELFEEQARRHPDAIAIVYGGRSWTYQDLDRRANRLAHALLDEGLCPEDAVAVVTERDLSWTAAVLAVLKAGGAYLPIDPQCPPERLATMLTRAGCAHVLTEPQSSTNLKGALAALPRVRQLLVPDLTEHPGNDTSPSIETRAGQLAYVFFTSGSTGEPKGAMCEHAGLLNHLFAKIDDLGIDAYSVVAQTASQCFDISLWQLLAPLMTGGRTVLVEQEAVLDADRFLDTIVEGRVTVLQVVPSYLDVILTTLEHSFRALPDLLCVSVTGEALRNELVQRWFTTGPGIRLVNAYGLTETSDDTNHEVMDHPPRSGRVPLGRPVNNVSVYVVDDHLVPVPLGAPGALVFSGICVGRGYVNDTERTRLAYRPDPYRPEQRLFLSGDFGRWLPDGKLEFLGRRDTQVKIRGFRVEIGEIENTLLRVPDVRDGAVVVNGPESRRRLTAFCTSGSTLTDKHLRRRLGDLLPAYMIPSTFHQLHTLPLTSNGKTDRSALATLADKLSTADDAPTHHRTPTEHRLAAAWASVLDTAPEEIGPGDNFFDLGGTSLSAVRLAVLLDRAICLRDLAGHPTLAGLARLMDTRTGTASDVLRPLLVPNGPTQAAVICFNDTDGTQTDFRPLAEALRRCRSRNADKVSVHVARQPDAARVAREIARIHAPWILLWGYGSGKGTAEETATAMQQQQTYPSSSLLFAHSCEEAAETALRAVTPPAE
ncbi:non-ribosomal peptide synthetase [Streptomyces fuscigenes]|uniref:non-ribosomal peptide synthetase n=1 Tax=Streptomyces fuscigenes TaxID=1528880 RepID=UPI001F2F4954|nr:non-ribosomal peptide synthetase [Streptomyces fuscigenes]MCF3960206.1 non-ribosomal peptide synthetase [Streptomyces fuscigenes]